MLGLRPMTLITEIAGHAREGGIDVLDLPVEVCNNDCLIGLFQGRGQSDLCLLGETALSDVDRIAVKIEFPTLE